MYSSEWFPYFWIISMWESNWLFYPWISVPTLSVTKTWKVKKGDKLHVNEFWWDLQQKTFESEILIQKIKTVVVTSRLFNLLQFKQTLLCYVSEYLISSNLTIGRIRGWGNLMASKNENARWKMYGGDFFKQIAWLNLIYCSNFVCWIGNMCFSHISFETKIKFANDVCKPLNFHAVFMRMVRLDRNIFH